MNKKNKVLLTSVALALVSGIAATSSTFAWFTTTRTASISYSKATISSAQSNLGIAFKSSKNATTSSLTDSALSIVSSSKITDISGDGVKFFKPTWSATTGVASKIAAVDYSAAQGAEGWFVDFTVTLTVSGQTAMNVYLGAGSGINPINAGNPADVKAVAASRMAVLENDAPLFYYAPNAAGEKHLTAASSTPVDVYANDASIPDASIASTALTTISSFSTLVANPATPAAAHAFIGQFAPTEVLPASKDITFRVWIEGQDADAVGAAIGGIFSIALNIYALDVSL